LLARAAKLRWICADRAASAAGGATGTNDRRQAYERQLGRRLVALSDRVEGDIARR